MNCQVREESLPEGARFCPNCGAAVGTSLGTEERRGVTVLFADLVDSTGLARRDETGLTSAPLPTPTHLHSARGKDKKPIAAAIGTKPRVTARPRLPYPGAPDAARPRPASHWSGGRAAPNRTVMTEPSSRQWMESGLERADQRFASRGRKEVMDVRGPEQRVGPHDAAKLPDLPNDSLRTRVLCIHEDLRLNFATHAAEANPSAALVRQVAPPLVKRSFERW
jgi:hypothetical protein